jgi:hypothetical protein
VTNQGPDRSAFDVYFPADRRWLEEGGLKIKARTERDAKKLRENQAWHNHLATLVGLWRFDTRSLPDPYDKHNKLYFGPVVRAEIYRRITGIKNYPKLIGHFRRSTFQDDLPVHVLLGFDDIPSRSTFRTADQERFTPETREFISIWAQLLARYAIQGGFEYPDIEDDYLANNGGITEVPVESKRGYVQAAMDFGREFFPLTKADHAQYTDAGLHFDFSIHLCDTNGTPQGELENFADNRGLQKGIDIFSAETFRNDIYRRSAWEWEATINRWTDRVLDVVYPDEKRERYLPVAIDTTNIPTWSSEQSDVDGVLGTEKAANTHYAYRILSAEAVSDGMPFQLAHELQMESGARDERLENLLEMVEDRGFNIGVVFIDSEFASGKVTNMLKERGTDFVIQVPTRWVSTYIDDFDDAASTVGVVDEYTMNKNKSYPEKSTNTLFASYEGIGSSSEEDSDQTKLLDFFDPESGWMTGNHTRKEVQALEEDEQPSETARWVTFITNLDINEDEARALRQYYKYRWAIETAYRKYKYNFLPTTRSTRLGMRIYLYLFGMFAYNTWVAANVKCRRQHLIDQRERPPIRASRANTLAMQRYRSEFGVQYPEV